MCAAVWVNPSCTLTGEKLHSAAAAAQCSAHAPGCCWRHQSALLVTLSHTTAFGPGTQATAAYSLLKPQPKPVSKPDQPCGPCRSSHPQTKYVLQQHSAMPLQEQGLCNDRAPETTHSTMHWQAPLSTPPPPPSHLPACLPGGAGMRLSGRTWWHPLLPLQLPGHTPALPPA